MVYSNYIACVGKIVRRLTVFKIFVVMLQEHSRFDVAIKQARSVDSPDQDDLLREAEKLSKLCDHPNVVNIKGITLEVAEDGLCRKYSLVLTVYTSGNLLGYLKKHENELKEDKTGRKLKTWAYQVREGNRY